MKTRFPLVYGFSAVCCLTCVAFSQVDESGDIEAQLRSRLQTMDDVPAPLAERYLDRVTRPEPSPPRPPYLYGTPYSGYHALFPYLGVEGFKADESGPVQRPPLAEQEIALAAKLRDSARQAFREGHYQQAAQFAAQADVIDHDNPETHELLSLAMFALKDYRGAAAEAHAVIFFGHPCDWPALLGHYSFANRHLYEAQFRQLEADVSNQPESAHTVFLLAYHYLMQGHLEQARTTLREAVALAPRDAIAKRLLAGLEAEPTAPSHAPPPPQPNRP